MALISIPRGQVSDALSSLLSSNSNSETNRFHQIDLS